MQFEWDLTKDAANIAKHELGFGEATAVFDDPHVLLEDSTKPEHGEVRWRAIGVVDGRMLTVIFTDRPTGCRIISARKARNDERERYRQGTATS